MTPVRDGPGAWCAPGARADVLEALDAIRRVQSRLPPDRRLEWNRVLLYVWPPLDLLRRGHRRPRRAARPRGPGARPGEAWPSRPDAASRAPRDARRGAPISKPAGTPSCSGSGRPTTSPSRRSPTTPRRWSGSRRRGLIYPYELVRMLAPGRRGSGPVPPGEFVEHDLDGDGRLVPVDRPPGAEPGQHRRRVRLQLHRPLPGGHGARDPARRPQPRAGLAGRARVPADHRRDGPGRGAAAAARVVRPVGGRAKIAMDSGTENMDWIAAVLRRDHRVHAGRRRDERGRRPGSTSARSPTGTPRPRC